MDNKYKDALEHIRPDQLMKWSKPVERTTIKGLTLVSTAPLTNGHPFWDIYRTNKQQLRDAGISCRRVGGGWEAVWYQPLTQEMLDDKAKARDVSHATDADIKIPAPEGLEYLGYQKAGVAYAMKRSNVLIADEMGLGKTIQAIGTVNAMQAKTGLVTCPASLKINWKREMEKWLTGGQTVAIVDSKMKKLPDADFIIINYDILKKFHAELRARVWDILIADECHALKNPKAQRTMEVVGGKKQVRYEDEHGYKRQKAVKIEPIKAGKIVFLTGTPIMNRPVELWPILHFLAPDVYSNWGSFAVRYCAGHRTRWGFDASGASNLAELQNRLREEVMVRRLKADVLTELPPKRRQVILLEPDREGKAAIAAENEAIEASDAEREALQVAAELAKASDDDEVYKNAVERLRDHSMATFTEMAKLRERTALAKLDAIIEHLADCEDKVVVMAHHKSVIRRIKQTFGDRAVTLTGDSSMEERQSAVDRFQTDESVRYFVGSIKAAGVGITLTAASYVLFAELDWTPGAMTQAEDRCHRIGQRDNVLVHHMVLDGSMDARMAQTLIRKQEIADKALDRDTGVEVAEARTEVIYLDPAETANEQKKVATRNASREKLAKEAESITDDQVEAIHLGLQMLAGMDQDRAMMQNDMGFNRIDGDIGHSLANAGRLTKKQAALGKRLVNKYRRQLPAELVARAKGTSNGDESND